MCPDDAPEPSRKKPSLIDSAGYRSASLPPDALRDLASRCRKRSHPPREVLILKADGFYAHALGRAVRGMVRGVKIRSCVRIADAAAALAERPVDLLLTGIGFSDGDALDFLPRWVGPEPRARKVLVVTTRKEPRLLLGLKSLAVDGVFDPLDGEEVKLEDALRAMVEDRSFWSRSVLDHLDKHVLCAHAMLRRLTSTERLVLAVIGDGSDDATAAEILDLKPSTIASVRRELHRKLRVQHKGDLQRIAAQLGLVRINFHGILRPGLEMLKAACRPRRRKSGVIQAD